MDEWAKYLLSGVIGSIIAGGVAAYVAMKVLRKTIAEQRNEARRSRQIEAAADLASSVQAVTAAFEYGEAGVTAAALRAQSAAIRWKIDADDLELARGIYELVVFYNAAVTYLGRSDNSSHMYSREFNDLVRISIELGDCMVTLVREPGSESTIAVARAIQQHRVQAESIIEPLKAAAAGM
ncbi:hypothetical protein [Arthrobacter sp. GMC3]|uniref:hypothetical protein n=1 Tax=Arthrobacter sp. GMC3 TaxID=2058894 RepID=UPI000CE33B93|nr:hypothetical protein [Arthrobacter sp. GMC3]